MTHGQGTDAPLVERTERLLRSLIEPYGEDAVLAASDGEHGDEPARVFRLESADGAGAPVEVSVPYSGWTLELSVATAGGLVPAMDSGDDDDHDGLAYLELIVREVLRGRVTVTARRRGGRDGARKLVVGDPAAPIANMWIGESLTDWLPVGRRERREFGPYAAPSDEVTVGQEVSQ